MSNTSAEADATSVARLGGSSASVGKVVSSGQQRAASLSQTCQTSGAGSTR